jgi:hypothetical protein
MKNRFYNKLMVSIENQIYNCFRPQFFKIIGMISALRLISKPEEVLHVG